MNNKLVNICIVHYNTPKLLEALILSIKKFVPKYHIYIFENSDSKPFKCENNENITIFDNSNGQIINFYLWLSNFKNKLITLGRTNDWGSAKHCVSIDKCFDLINDNFILLDSDVLLKKDISELFDDKYDIIGEICYKKNSKARLIPFICFINVKKCKEMGIHYFDEKRMLGLGFNNSYDTGASFYEDIEKKGGKRLEIKYNDYVSHYGAASYIKSKKITKEEWLKRNKDLYDIETDNNNKNNKRLICTCITGKYEKPFDNFNHVDGYDYILISDDIIETKSWNNILINFDCKKKISYVKKQRYVKTHLCELFPDYELITYIDANTSVDDKLYRYIEENKDNNITFKKHPIRNCIYDEMDACIKLKKELKLNIGIIRKKYIKENYPKCNGLFETNILVFKTNDKDVINLFKLWWREIFYNSHRDQLSLNYVIWKYNLESIISVSKSNDFNPQKHIKND